MSRLMHSVEEVKVPKDVTVVASNRVMKVTGPRGTLTRNVRHLRNLAISVVGTKKRGQRVRVELWFGTRKSVACVRTVCAHLTNMITGVTKGFEAKMRFVYAHFPINTLVSDKKDEIHVNNFLGEKMARVIHMPQGVTVFRSEKVKDEIVLQGNDIELVTQSAARIHQSAKVPDKDIRKFLDGVYVSESHVLGQ